VRVSKDFRAYSPFICKRMHQRLTQFAVVAATALCTAHAAKAGFTFGYKGAQFDVRACERERAKQHNPNWSCLPSGNLSVSFTYAGSFPKHYTGEIILNEETFPYKLKAAQESFNGYTFNFPPDEGNDGVALTFQDGKITEGSVGLLCADGNDYPECPRQYEDVSIGTCCADNIRDWVQFTTAKEPQYYNQAYNYTFGKWAVTGSRSAPPIAVDEYAYSIHFKPVRIDLGKGSTGYPYKATLVGTLTGGTVKGFPNTVVTFTPELSAPQGTFQFTLTNTGGTSNTATSTVTATLLSPEEKQLFCQFGVSFQDVSQAFEAAAIVAEGRSNAVQNIGLFVGTRVLTAALTQNDQLSGQTADFLLSAAQFGAFALNHLSKTNIVSIPLEIDSLVFGLTGLASNVLCADPPDNNYKVITKPDRVHFPKTGDEKLDKIEQDYITYAALETAVVHGAERWEGAELANNPKWAQIQETAFNRYSQEAGTAVAQLNADDKKLASELPAVQINSYPGGAKALAKVYNEQCGSALPREVYRRLSKYTLSKGEIDQMACNYVNMITRRNVSTNFASALRMSLPN